LSVTHSVPASLGTDAGLSYSTVVGATLGSRQGASVTIQLPAGLGNRQASGQGWSCSVSGSAATCTRTDTISAPNSYPAIATTGQLTTCGQALASSATRTITDANAANNTSSGTTSGTCPGVSLDLISDGSTLLLPGASHSFSPVLLSTINRTIDPFTWSLTASNGTITAFNTAGSSCAQPSPNDLDCQRSQPITGSSGTGGFAFNLGSVLVRPTSCAQPLTLQLEVQESASLDVPGPNPYSESFTVPCSPPSYTLTASPPTAVLQGQPTTWTLNLQNSGESPTIGQVTVSATLPLLDANGRTILAGLVGTGSGWTCTTATANPNQTVTCTRSGSVGNGASAPPITLSGTAGLCTTSRTEERSFLTLPAYALSATASGGGATAGASANQSTPSRCANLQTSISADSDTITRPQEQLLFVSLNNAADAAPAFADHELEVRVTAPGALSTLTISGGGWSCTPTSDGALCAAPGPLAPGFSQPTIFVTLARAPCSAGSSGIVSGNLVTVIMRGGGAPADTAVHTTNFVCP
jgi:large repetitive protein